MKCEICKNGSSLFVLLPIHQPDGKMCILTCEDCAKKSTAYCTKHSLPHLGFIDGTTACHMCIEEVVRLNEKHAVSIRDKLWTVLPDDQAEELNEAAEIAAEIMNCSESVAVLRFIASKAARTNQSVQDVVNLLTDSGHYSVGYILWM